MKSKSNKSKPTHLYASLSIAIVLFLLGLFFVLLIHSQNMATLAKENINVIVEVVDEADTDSLTKKISANHQIKKGSVRHISKAEGLKMMLGEDSGLTLDDNPLSDLIVFNVKADYYSDENLEKLKSIVQAESGVSGVYYENMALDQIRANINKLAIVLLGLGLVFIFLAVVIIRNTINLSMYADREEIITLERIGAKWSFIKLPYIKSSVIVGVKGFIIAVVSLIIIFAAVSINFPKLWEVINIFYVALSILLLLIVAIVIPALVSNSAANSYLAK